MRTVIEFLEFIKKVEREFGEEERENIVSFLSENPKSGQTLENFGGIRKLEWHRKMGQISNLDLYPGSNG